MVRGPRTSLSILQVSVKDSYSVASCSLFTLHITLLPSSVLPADPPLFPWQCLSPVPWPVDALPQ